MKDVGVMCRNIVVADRNPRVRNLLKRELASSGLKIRLAENAGELLDIVYSRTPISLLVLDPDLPGIEDFNIFKRLKDRNPALPIILHEIRGADTPLDLDDKTVLRIEKNGYSIEVLKKSICELLKEAFSKPA